MSDLSATYVALSRKPARKGLMAYIDLYRQRKALRSLTDGQLEDVGLTRTQALTEAHRPVWDAPHHWMR
jgi:uncharacterized protein YjiS (DUF1127 family)